MRTGHRHQGRTMHSRSTDYEYCCGFLSSSLVNIQLVFPLDIYLLEIYLLCCYWTLCLVVATTIIFIQKPSQSSICSIPSSTNKEEEKLIEVSNHLNQIIFSRNPTCVGDSPRVIIYINIRISSLQFSLQKNIFNYRDISCIFFFNCRLPYFLINIYLDSFQLALKYLKNTKVNINNVLIMTRDFNIRYSIWNPDFPYHLIQGHSFQSCRFLLARFV